MRVKLGELPFLIVSTVEVAKEVLRTHDLAAEAFSYNYTGIGFAPYGEPWRVLKKLCTVELLSMKRVHSFRHIRQEETENLARFIAALDGGAVDLSERGHLLAYDIVTRASVGARTKDRLKVIRMIRRLSKFGAGFNAADLYPSVKVLPFLTGIQFKIEKIHREMDGMFEGIIAEARAAESDDGFEELLSILLKCQAERSEMAITDDDIKAVMLDMFLAGSETSAAVIEWAMGDVGAGEESPHTEKSARGSEQVFDSTGRVDEERIPELKYLPLAIKETLRIHAPLPFMMPRLNSSMCTLNGYDIPTNTRLIVHAGALGKDPVLGKDPKYWPDAEQFKPERFEGAAIDYKGNDLEYLPFGSGRRLCPGINFGAANVDLTLATLLYHFDWEVPHGVRNEDLDMMEAFAVTVRRKNPLVLVPTVKRPLNVVK
ncbi:unspecific monooxygenase [Salvia divinorum]|uniref:Unspecific monooxygenase n=1 Tax=Salvia divinorum TaxID=28513 RepID=A0ABD1FKM2_SALDI